MLFRRSSYYSILPLVVLISDALGAPKPLQHTNTDQTLDTRSSMISPGTRATWVWNTADVVTNTTGTAQFLAFAQLNQLNRVYVHIDPDVSQKAFEVFVQACNRTGSGIAVEALMGDPEWILQTSPSSMATRLQWIKQYQKTAVNASSQLRGLHIDIEPWNLDGWAANTPAYIAKWVNLVRAFKRWGNAQTPALPLAADFPFWLNTLSTAQNVSLDLAMMNIVDSATFMTYRNTPAALLEIASAPLQVAAACGGKQVILAVETRENDEATWVSYYGLGRNRLTNDLASLQTTNINWFGGLAIHDYDHWAAMQ